MTTKMSTRLQRLEERIRPLEEERFERWLRDCPIEELKSYVTDEAKAELEILETLSNEQLIRIVNGEPLSVVLGRERKLT